MISFFFIRKFCFGLQEGIATILVRTLVCHMPASVWPFSGLYWAHFPLCTVAGQPALIRSVLHFPDRNCGWEIFESCHFLFWISSFPVGIGLRGPRWPSLASAGIGQVIHFVVSIRVLSIRCSSKGVTVLSLGHLAPCTGLGLASPFTKVFTRLLHFSGWNCLALCV